LCYTQNLILVSRFNHSSILPRYLRHEMIVTCHMSCHANLSSHPARIRNTSQAFSPLGSFPCVEIRFRNEKCGACKTKTHILASPPLSPRLALVSWLGGMHAEKMPLPCLFSTRVHMMLWLRCSSVIGGPSCAW
jgi:hypothetical protein